MESLCFDLETGKCCCDHDNEDPICTCQLEAMIWRRKQNKMKKFQQWLGNDE